MIRGSQGIDRQMLPGVLRRLRKAVFAIRNGGALGLLDGLAPATEHSRIGYLRIDHVIDVGANRGQFSSMAKLLWPGATIDAFEPLDDIREVFARHLAAKGCRVHGLALSDGAGFTEIHVSASDDSSSLHAIGEVQARLFPGTHEIERRRVRTETLDSFFPNLDDRGRVLLKIDVQGHELAVLRGAKATLSKIEYVYVECSYLELYSNQSLVDDVYAFLADAGFGLIGVLNTTYDQSGRAIQSDFLFEHRHPGSN